MSFFSCFFFFWRGEKYANEDVHKSARTSTEEGIPSIADSLFGQLYLISSFGSSSSSSSFFLLFDAETELGVLAADDYSLNKVIENVGQNTCKTGI